MNQTQIRYAKERAKKIYESKCKEISKKHTTNEIKLSAEQRLEALKFGNYTLVDKVGKYGGYYLTDFIIFPEEKHSFVDTKKVDKEIKVLTASYDNLLDTLILGDEKEALKLLEDFMNS